MSSRKGRVLSLCDHSGVMVEPWINAGYEATIVDLRHKGTTIEGLLTKVEADVTKWMPPLDEYAIVFAFPPCTHLAKSGARWWKTKGLTALIEGLTVVDACRRICEWAAAPYMIENPSGALSTHWRKPDHAFDPLDYGAYVLDGEDFTKHAASPRGVSLGRCSRRTPSCQKGVSMTMWHEGTGEIDE